MFALLVAITFHEFSHALIATRLGDPTARNLGRLSLNPLVHIDPMGAIMIFLIGFGWGKPVPVQPHYLRTKPRIGMAAVAFAGPVSNVVMAIVFAFLVRTNAIPVGTLGIMGSTDIATFLLTTMVRLNLALAIFNLIPIEPLDGFKVALGLLPDKFAEPMERYGRNGIAILFIVVMLDFVVPGLNIISRVILPPVNLLESLLLG